MLQTSVLSTKIEEGLILRGYFLASNDNKKEMILEVIKELVSEKAGLSKDTDYELVDILYLLDKKISNSRDNLVTFESYNSCLINLMSNMQGYVISRTNSCELRPEIIKNDFGYVSEISININKKPVENTVDLINYFDNEFMEIMKVTTK